MYTIAILGKTKADVLANAIQTRLQKDGRFRVQHLEVGEVKTTREDRRTMGQIYFVPAILMKGIRLAHKRDYCGQHFGPCPVGTPTKKYSYLEYDDWVAFHALVNGLLNQRHINANVWTNPMEGGVSKMWIRKGTRARIRWDAEEIYDERGRHIGRWNAGDESQFME